MPGVLGECCFSPRFFFRALLLHSPKSKAKTEDSSGRAQVHSSFLKRNWPLFVR